MSEHKQETEVKTPAKSTAASGKKTVKSSSAASSAKKTPAGGKTAAKKTNGSGGAVKKTASAAASKSASAKTKKSKTQKNGFAKVIEKAVSGAKSAANGLGESIRSAKEKSEVRKNEKKPLTKKEQRRRKRLMWKIIRRSLLCVVTLLLLAVFGVYMVMYTVFKGPSQTACDLLVNSTLETSALKFVPYLYFSAEEVDEIVARNAVKAPDEDTDTSLIVIDRSPKSEGENGAVEEKDIEIVEVSGATYHGYMMIVKDPARVTLAVCDPEFDSRYGKYLDEMAVENGAVAAINAGGFEDEGGSGRGGKPLGIVIKDGKVLNAKRSSECSIVIGFDKDDKLIVGDMTADEAIERGMRDAASFDPVLILNGEPAEVSGSSSGLNPRTAIGQRADGAVLLLVIDGRQVNSMGASLADLIDVMMQFGAVNAANLDGGSSSKMWYEGEFVNDGVALTGSRRLPTAFIVK